MANLKVGVRTSMTHRIIAIACVFAEEPTAEHCNLIQTTLDEMVGPGRVPATRVDKVTIREVRQQQMVIGRLLADTTIRNDKLPAFHEQVRRIFIELMEAEGYKGVVMPTRRSE